MQRPKRHLDTKRQREGQKQPELGARRNQTAAVAERLEQHGIVEGSDAGGALMNEIKRNDANQHQERSNGGVDKKLDGRIDTPLAAPNADEEEHRYEGSLEEQVEEQQIERDKDADHRRLQQQHQHVIRQLALGDGSPA